MKTSGKDFLFVGMQMVLFALYLFDPLPKFEIAGVFSYIGLVIALFGIVIAAVAVLKLRWNLTAFPTPKSGSQLVTSGIYRYVRHPIYSGILLFVFGYAVFRMSLFKLFIMVLLLILFRFKCGFEEQQLRKKYPEYINYQERTGMFFPKIFTKK